MPDSNGRPNKIEDWLVKHKAGQWFGWAKELEPRKVYSNLVTHDGSEKPTEQECTDGLAALQTAFDDEKTKLAEDKTSGNNKLKALGLTDDEIVAVTK